MNELMTLLSDAQIMERLFSLDKKRRIELRPLVDACVQLGASSIDIHLGPSFKLFESGKAQALDLSGTAEELRNTLSRITRSERIKPGDQFVLHPGEFILGAAFEYLRLPNDLAARIEGRSSYGRLGLQIHATAGFVDPGYEGNLTFELINSGKVPMQLKSGLRMAQLCFFHVQGVTIPYRQKKGYKYGRRFGVEGSSVDQDLDRRA